MKIEMDFVELHTPLFLAGTNMQTKLDKEKKTGLVMLYENTEKMLYVYYNRRMAMVPEANIASMTRHEETRPPALSEKKPAAKEPEVRVVVPQPEDPVKAFKERQASTRAPAKPVVKTNAQVSGPTHHVFAGEGAGKVRD